MTASATSRSGLNQVAVASDHAGYQLKTALIQYLEENGYEPVDLGTDSTDSVDYPDFGEKLAKGIINGSWERGALVCGTGIGMSIAANRHKGVRAALCHDAVSARLSREHNDANVIVLGARTINEQTAKECLGTFLTTSFEGGRHERRVSKLG